MRLQDPVRALTPSQVEAVRAARSRGVGARALAACYGVSLRTIYRAVHQKSPYVVVQVGDWKAEFVLTAHGPVRATAWVAA